MENKRIIDTKNGKKGITLIALAVTIVVLIIIASISIGVLMGDDGIINNTKLAKEQSEINAEREVVEQATTIVMGKDKYGIVKKDALAKEIDKYTGEGNTKVEEIQGAEALEVTFLESNRSYYVDAESGDISELKIETSSLTITCIPDGEFTDGNVTVKIEAEQEYIDDNYDIYYKTSKKNNWTKYTSEFELSMNQTVFAKLQKSDKVAALASTTITNIDKLPPNDFEAQITTTTKSVKIVANTTDQVATSEYGCSGLSGYRFSKDDGSTWTAWQENGTYTFNNLNQNTNFDLKIEAKDKAGNIITVSSKATTQTVAALIKDGNVTFSSNPSGWTNQDVTVTASTTVSGFTIQMSTDKTDWSDTTTKTRSTNGAVYARLTDGINVGDYAICNVTNIDKTAPTISSYTSNSPSTTVTITGTAQDTGSGISAYMFSQDGSLDESSSGWQSITATTSSVTKTQDVTTEGTWYFYVKDQVGNYSKSSLSDIVTQVYWAYEYTGGSQTWTAPLSGYYDVVLNGAAGGTSASVETESVSSPQLSANGGRVNLRIYAQKGAVLYIVVGGRRRRRRNIWSV